MLDPAKVAAGRAGGLARARSRMSHLSDTEREIVYELERQARSYRDGTHGSPVAVAGWLRTLADRLIESTH